MISCRLLQKYLLLLSLLVLIIFNLTAAGNVILSSPRLINAGNWGDWDRCPEGTFVMGMRLKTEPYQGPLDDTGLNGIQFLCGRTGDSSRQVQNRRIHSLVGDWGSWGNYYECPNGLYAIGFQLRTEAPQDNRDDTAANNLRIFCSRNVAYYLEGAGLHWGEWSPLQMCPRGQAICSLRTQVQPSQGPNSDDTSLNNLDVECCKIRL